MAARISRAAIECQGQQPRPRLSPRPLGSVVRRAQPPTRSPRTPGRLGQLRRTPQASGRVPPSRGGIGRASSRDALTGFRILTARRISGLNVGAIETKAVRPSFSSLRFALHSIYHAPLFWLDSEKTSSRQFGE